MEKEKNECCSGRNWDKNTCASSGAVYGFGLFGALFYYLGNAGNFGQVVMGILKSLVWPAMMVYHLFNYLKM